MTTGHWAKITSGTFSKTVRNPGLRAGDHVRAIGLSVAVKKADGHDPPAFETFTWCVTVKVKKSGTRKREPAVPGGPGSG